VALPPAARIALAASPRRAALALSQAAGTTVRHLDVRKRSKISIETATDNLAALA
jgi:hypothetical protein